MQFRTREQMLKMIAEADELRRVHPQEFIVFPTRMRRRVLDGRIESFGRIERLIAGTDDEPRMRVVFDDGACVYLLPSRWYEFENEIWYGSCIQYVLDKQHAIVHVTPL